MIALRASSETLKYGDFAPIYAKGGVIAYSRTSRNEQTQQSKQAEQYVIILNFSGEKEQVDFHAFKGNASGKSPADYKIVVTNTEAKTFTSTLKPWEAVVLLLLLSTP